MSELPRYQRLTDEEHGHEGLRKDTSLGAEDDVIDHLAGEDLPTYPPDRSSRNARPTKRVELRFMPRWPYRGHEKSVFGFVGNTTEETVDIVRGLFPELQDHPPERVELLLLSTTGWQPVMSDVWHTIAEDPPDQLGVRIADLPGQEDRRSLREIGIIFGCLFSIFGFIVIVSVAGAMIFGGGEKTPDRSE